MRPASVEKYIPESTGQKKDLKILQPGKSAQEVLQGIRQRQVQRFDPERYINLERIDERIGDAEDDKEAKLD